LTLLARIGKVIGPERAKASNDGKTKSVILLSQQQKNIMGVALGRCTARLKEIGDFVSKRCY
jgi:hypothetical protein